MNFQTMHPQRKIILIAAAVGFLATFLPWASVSAMGFSQSANGWHGIGMLAPAGFALAGVIAFLGDQVLPLARGNWFAAMAGGALALLGTIIYMVRISSALGDVGMLGGLVQVGYGIGIWLSLLAGAGILFGAWTKRSPGDSLQSGFDSMKGDLSNRMNSGSTGINRNTTSTETRVTDSTTNSAAAGDSEI